MISAKVPQLTLSAETTEISVDEHPVFFRGECPADNADGRSKTMTWI